MTESSGVPAKANAFVGKGETAEQLSFGPWVKMDFVTLISTRPALLVCRISNFLECVKGPLV